MNSKTIAKKIDEFRKKNTVVSANEKNEKSHKLIHMKDYKQQINHFDVSIMQAKLAKAYKNLSCKLILKNRDFSTNVSTTLTANPKWQHFPFKIKQGPNEKIVIKVLKGSKTQAEYTTTTDEILNNDITEQWVTFQDKNNADC